MLPTRITRFVGLCAMVILLVAAVGCGPVSSESSRRGEARGYRSRGGQEQRWRATAYLQISSQRPQVNAAVDDQIPYERFVRTQVELIKSPVVLAQVAANPDLAKVAERSSVERPLAWLALRTSAGSVNDSELFTISFDGKTAEDAAAAANLIANTFLKSAVDEDARGSQQIVDLLEREMDRRTRELERLRQSVRALVKMTQGDDYVPTNDIQGRRPPGEENPIVAMKKLLNQTRSHRTELESRLKAIKESLDKKEIKLDPTEIEELIATDVLLNDLRKSLESKRGELRTAEAAGDEVPSRVSAKLRDEMVALERQMVQRDTELRERITKNLERAKQFEREQLLSQLELEIETKKKLETQLSTNVEEAIKHWEKQNNHTLDLEFLRQDLERSEAIFKTIADRSEALKTEMRAPDRIRLLRAADPAEAELVWVPRGSS